MKNILGLIVAMTVFSVTAQSAYKLVDGKVYNVLDPDAWTAFPDILKVIGYSEDGIICERYTIETTVSGIQVVHAANPRYYPILDARIIHGHKLILKNYHSLTNVPLGSDITPTIKAIRTGQTLITRSGDEWTANSSYSRGDIWTTVNSVSNEIVVCKCI